jgi:hypothetical protein
MAVQAPPVLLVVIFQLDILVKFFQLPSVVIDFLIIMAIRTGEDVLGKGRRRNKELRDIGFFGRYLFSDRR